MLPVYYSLDLLFVVFPIVPIDYNNIILTKVIAKIREHCITAITLQCDQISLVMITFTRSSKSLQVKMKVS